MIKKYTLKKKGFSFFVACRSSNAFPRPVRETPSFANIIREYPAYMAGNAISRHALMRPRRIKAATRLLWQTRKTS